MFVCAGSHESHLMKIDFHVHCCERSACATSSAEEQVRAAIAAGIDGLFFTDHFRLVPAGQLAELARRYAPFQIFSGIEITVDQEDILVLGVQDERLERPDWSYPALHAFVRSQGGYLILAHPFRFRHAINPQLTALPPDAVELYSNNTPAAAQAEIRIFAERLNLRLLSNSDAHTAKRLGGFYNILPRPAVSDGEVIAQLQGGQPGLYFS